MDKKINNWHSIDNASATDNYTLNQEWAKKVKNKSNSQIKNSEALMMKLLKGNHMPKWTANMQEAREDIKVDIWQHYQEGDQLQLYYRTFYPLQQWRWRLNVDSLIEKVDVKHELECNMPNYKKPKKIYVSKAHSVDLKMAIVTLSEKETLLLSSKLLEITQ